MNEVSIIINGVRYDAVEDGSNQCDTCDLRELSEIKSANVNETSLELLGEDNNFKKSDKKFER